MPSPFPGMDPYLEGQCRWPDFHAHFLTYACDDLRAILPEGYEARIEEQFRLVDVAGDGGREFRADVAVALNPSPPARAAAPAGGVLTLEPVTIPLPTSVMEVRETWIEIHHDREQRLITVIGVLSPSNKAGTGRSDYLSKRRSLIRQEVHLVESDLLVAGQRLPLRDELPRGDYYALVSRGDHRPDCQVYAWSVRRPLPTIPIPLLAPDPDLPLDLAAVFSTVFQRGRYARMIDYAAPLGVPLAPEDRAWAEGLARAVAQPEGG